MSPAQRKRTRPSCTVLFVDVCDSTGLYATLGNARAQAAIVRTLEILSRIAIRHRGTVVKTAGDGGLCTFPTAADGAEAAVEMQRSVQRTTTLADIGVESLAIRAGFHSGPVISREGDVFGDAVNVAARMVALAKPGQIIVAKQTAKGLAKSTSIRFVGSIEVKGKSEPFDVFEIVWDHTNLTEMRVVSTAERRNSRLTVVFGTSTIEVDHRRPVIRMGRGPDNEIVVPHAVASRVHARIEYRRGRFILVDQSLNGTYLDIHGRDGDSPAQGRNCTRGVRPDKPRQVGRRPTRVVRAVLDSQWRGLLSDCHAPVGLQLGVVSGPAVCVRTPARGAANRALAAGRKQQEAGQPAHPSRAAAPH